MTLYKHLAVTLQSLLTHRINLQAPTQTAQPFLTQFAHLLRQMKVCPLTHFQIPKCKESLYQDFYSKFKKINTELHQHKATVLPQVDKGTGLVVITKTTLARLYNQYLSYRDQISSLTALRLALNFREVIYQFNQSLYTLHEDNRNPNFYFKVKVHPTQLLPFFRPVVNHSA